MLDGRLVDGYRPLDDPLALADATLFLPSRRAARALSGSFMKRLGGSGATLLPKIRTLGDVSDEDFGLHIDASELDALPETINPVARRLELGYLVHKWVEQLGADTRALYGEEDIIIPSSRADALRLADDLCVLMGQIAQEEIQWRDILDIVPDDHADWWQLTSQFLKIIAEFWPARLEAQGLIDPAERAVRLLDLRTERLERNPPDGPVIVAGSTGSVPSTQRLLMAVSRLPNGAVVLPGLDQSMPETEWQKLSGTSPEEDPTLETHPQFGLAKLLLAVGAERDNVLRLRSKTDSVPPPFHLRRKLISTALAPADFTGDWIDRASELKPEAIDEALAHVTLIEAGNQRMEALAIAVAMREVLETGDRAAALVTPDRNLAERVSTELRRFNVDVDDSGGTPLSNSKPTIFLRQMLDCLYGEGRNATLASFLKNPYCLAGRDLTEALLIGQHIELVGIRGAINPVRIGDLQSGLIRRQQELSEANHVAKAIKRIDETAWATMLDHAGSLDAILEPLVELRGTEAAFPIAEMIHRVRHVFSMLAGNWAERDTEGNRELSDLMDHLIEATDCPFTITWQDIPPVFDTLISGTNTRPAANTHPRLHIYGPLEVRLLDHDRIILGGLNEGTWPQATRNDAFLNRAMRHEIGMATPERRTGLAAHDFQQLMGKREIILARASRVDKAPTVASRWLQRLNALVGKDQWAKLTKRGEQYLDYATALDETAEPSKRIERPNPKPPVRLRPKRLPVTDIETWIRDPYALYAKRILGLQPIDPLEREPDPMLRGTLYHRIMQYYIESDPLKKPKAERIDLLNDLAAEVIADENLEPDVSRTWTLRFREIAEPYIEWEEATYGDNGRARSLVELQGQIRLQEGDFELTARADRIDITAGGQASLMDYKNGNNPSQKQARTLSPQLALEGLIAKQDGFEVKGTDLLQDLIYVRLRRGAEFKAESITDKNNSVDSIIEYARDELNRLVKGFQFEEQGYVSRRVPFKEGDISGDYDHLARTREWSFGEEDGDG